MSSKTHREIEIKLRISGVDRLKDAGLNLTLETPRHFEDNWLFDATDGVLSARQAILRVRRVGDRGVLTYKEKTPDDAPASQFKERIEIETVIEDPENTVAILKRLGYRAWFRYQKYRTVYRAYLPDGGALDVMFDETPIGDFVELEGEEAALAEAVRLLDVTREEYIFDSYLALQIKYCEEAGKKLEDMIF
jgi:adenylate cyclase, class 2